MSHKNEAKILSGIRELISIPRVKIIEDNDFYYKGKPDREDDPDEYLIYKDQRNLAGTIGIPASEISENLYELRLCLRQVLMVKYIFQNNVPSEFREIMMSHNIREITYSDCHAINILGLDPHTISEHDDILYALKYFPLHLQKEYFGYLKRFREITMSIFVSKKHEKPEEKEARKQEILEILKCGPFNEYDLRDYIADFFEDREVVLAAIKNNWEVIRYAKRFQGDRELIMTAIRQDGRALEFSSEKLRDDRELVIAAIEDDNIYFFWNLIPKKLQNDPEIIQAVKAREKKR